MTRSDPGTTNTGLNHPTFLFQKLPNELGLCAEDAVLSAYKQLIMSYDISQAHLARSIWSCKPDSSSLQVWFLQSRESTRNQSGRNWLQFDLR